MKHTKKEVYLALLRISLGLLFLWAFFDKLFGLGFATQSGKAWINGVSPTLGFLSKAVHGPLKEFYNTIAPYDIVAWLFMLGLLGIGISCTFGIATRLGCFSGAAMSLLMWSALLPPTNHPFIDDHIIYLFAFLVLAYSDTGKVWGFGTWWEKVTKNKK
ncbi:DoxX family membrane protein [Candidatus Pacearchaeota archaeon]|nr:DoxX family membrane protein [Candidatus Pacearchaeota archaeon]